MDTLIRRCVLVSCIVLLACAGAAVADHHEQAAEKTMEHTGEMGTEGHGHGEAGMDPAMMEAWQKAMAVGPQHEELATATGTWTATVTMWDAPGAPPSTATGTFERKLMLGGRVLAESFTSEMMGMAFEGHGMTGYDNVTGKYWSTWNDNMSTGVMVQYGAWDEAAGAVVFTGDMVDPMSGETMMVKTVLKHLEDGSEMMEMYHSRGGEEMKVMEIRSVKQ